MNVGTCAIVREIDLNGVLNKFHSRTKYPTGMKSCAAQDSIPVTNVIYPAAISPYVVIRTDPRYCHVWGDLKFAPRKFSWRILNVRMHALRTVTPFTRRYSNATDCQVRKNVQFYVELFPGRAIKRRDQSTVRLRFKNKISHSVK